MASGAEAIPKEYEFKGWLPWGGCHRLVAMGLSATISVARNGARVAAAFCAEGVRVVTRCYWRRVRTAMGLLSLFYGLR
jgi:hypothetical protein